MKKQRFIVDGALLLAIYVVLLFAAVYMPFIGMIFVFLLPLPFIIFTSKYSVKRALILLVGATILGLLFTSVIGLAFTLMFGISGIVYGFLVKKEKQPLEVLLGVTLAYLGTLVLFYVLANSILGINFNALLDQSIRETMELYKQISQATGTQNETLLTDLEEGLKLYTYLLPSTFVIVSFMFALVTQLLSQPILRRLKVKYSQLPPLRNISIPKSMLWYYLIVLVFLFFDLEVGSFLYMAVMNLFYILQLLMVIQGLSFVFYFSHQKKLPKIVPIIILVLTPFLLSIIRILGIIDLGFQLRSKIKPKS